ncbi:MAG: GntR family transcriptional regulator [Chloroflexota bacterium]|jgi:DNA-binding GntR family transcriptional regulator
MTDDAGITRSVLSEQVKGRLLQAILDGRYPPGARIVETRVAKEFGTSQAPVREALRDLEALGVVETAPFKGARVRRPSIEELLEAFEVRAILEGHGAVLAVENITADDLDRLRELTEEMRAAATEGDPFGEATADTDFHRLIMQHSGNATLVRVWGTLEPFLRTYITIVSPGVDRRAVADRHLPIIEALRRGNPELIEEAFRVHFEAAAAALAKVWPHHEPDDDADQQPRPDRMPAVAI